MAGHDASEGEIIEARIVYWGIEGAGKTTNLRTIYARLKPSNRGELRRVATRLDPTVQYEVLPIELGELKGGRARLQVIAVPGAPEQAPTRKQLLDQVMGVVFVVDSRRECLDANVASFRELRSTLAAYGRRLEDLPIVVQYNKHDLADPVALDALHRKLDIPGAAVFETIASEAGGPLRTLTTISKRVLQILREQDVRPAPAPAPAPVRVQPTVQPSAPMPSAAKAPARPAPDSRAVLARRERTRMMEEAMLAEESGVEESALAGDAASEAERVLDRPWEDLSADLDKPRAGVLLGPELRIVSVGAAEIVAPRTLRLPLVLGDAAGGTASLSVSISLDAIPDGPLGDREDP